MSRGDLNIGRLEGKQALKPRIGRNSSARRRVGRVVSKARRRATRAELLSENLTARDE